MRVGRDYQAQVPPITPLTGNSTLTYISLFLNDFQSFLFGADRKLDQYAERALLVWSPTSEILDLKCIWKLVLVLGSIITLMWLLFLLSGRIYQSSQRKVWLQFRTGIGNAVLAQTRFGESHG